MKEMRAPAFLIPIALPLSPISPSQFRGFQPETKYQLREQRAYKGASYDVGAEAAMTANDFHRAMLIGGHSGAAVEPCVASRSRRYEHGDELRNTVITQTRR